MTTKILNKSLFILVLFILLLILSNKNRERFVNSKIFAIHTVFIAKENILFLEQWIDYHIQLGFNKFYLYDNSKVQKTGGCHAKVPHVVIGKINKYNINYDNLVKLTDKEINEILKNIKKKYKVVEIIEWAPKNKNGIIEHQQSNAHNHCLKRMKKDNVEWAAIIDMDEFIVIKNGKTINKYLNSLKNNVSNVQLKQIRLSSRFNNFHKLIIDVTESEFPNGKYLGKHSPKNIFKVNKTNKLDVHDWIGNGKQIEPHQKEICFNHYKINKPKYKQKTNIDYKIRKKIYNNSKNYLYP